jgi:hypothetical protein
MATPPSRVLVSLRAGGESSTAELSPMMKNRRGVRRITALVVGCGAAGLAIGWRYAERGRVTTPMTGR